MLQQIFKAFKINFMALIWSIPCWLPHPMLSTELHPFAAHFLGKYRLKFQDHFCTQDLRLTFLKMSASKCWITPNEIQSNFDGSNSSGPLVRVRLIHVFERYLALQFSSWFMCSRCHHGHHIFYRLKVQSARDTFHWSITLCTLELKW